MRQKIKYLKKSLDEEYNTKALQEITYIITTKIQFNEEYEVYYNMVKDSFKSKDLNILNIEMYKRFGFVDLGMSDSVWGGEEWHEMTYYLR